VLVTTLPLLTDRDRHLAGKHRLRHGRRAGDIDELRVKTFLFVKPRFFADPERQEHRTHRRVANHQRLGRRICARHVPAQHQA
jgi:hypothetical protein